MLAFPPFLSLSFQPIQVVVSSDLPLGERAVVVAWPDSFCIDLSQNVAAERAQDISIYL